MPAPIRMLTKADLAFVMQCSRRTIERMASAGTLGLTEQHVGRDVRYSPGEVAARLGVTVEQLCESLVTAQSEAAA